MYTLGINAAISDASACLVRDGMVIAGAEEERFTGVRPSRRNTPFSPCGIPFHAINYCLAEERIVLSDIDHIAYSFDPYVLRTGPNASHSEWDPAFLSAVSNAPKQLCGDVPQYLEERFGNVDSDGPFVWHFVEHHLAHASSAFLASPFESAAVITMDAGGETAATTYSLGTPGGINGLGEVPAGHSFERLWQLVTSHLGFQETWDECKTFELAALGAPLYTGEFRSLLVLKENGQYITQNTPLEGLFGPPRAAHEQLEKKHFDIAASLQVVLQEALLSVATWLQKETGEDNLCVAGDLALNAPLNAFLREKAPFKEVWVQPAAGDSGTAMGAALWIDGLERRHLDMPRGYVMKSADLGPSYPDHVIETFLKRTGMSYRRLRDTAVETAELLVQKKTVGWFQGRMEFGPRSLGCRSILASPLDPAMKKLLNHLKEREPFRPFAAALPAEAAGEWFTDSRPSPFMLFTARVRPEKAGLIPACCHSGSTAGIQTVEKEQNPLFHALLSAFGARTGIPVLMHTSLNLSGKPLSCSPQDAAECFWTMPLNALVMGPFLVEKPS